MQLSCNIRERLQGSIQLPASKSLSNRALILQALSRDAFHIRNLSEAEDTRILQHLLARRMEQEGPMELNARDAGTAYRFLTAFLALCAHTETTLLGTARMLERPIGPLVDALRQLGADMAYLGEPGYPPLQIRGKHLLGGRLEIGSDISSQFVSALCLIAPALPQGLILDLRNQKVSWSYIHMTTGLLEQLGYLVHRQDDMVRIEASQPRVRQLLIEPDWSSAAFFYAMAILRPETEFELPGLKADSLQGDAAVAGICAHFGVKSTYHKQGLRIQSSEVPALSDLEIDLSSYPDLALPLMTACAIRHPEVRFTGIQHLQYKESDRLRALARELSKAGIEMQESLGKVWFRQAVILPPGMRLSFNTSGDHRMAMALSTLSVLGYFITLDDARCAQKSFPGYWDELEVLGFRVDEGE